MDQILHEELEAIKIRLDVITVNLEKVSVMQQNDHTMTVEHDKILIRGNGVPSLQEVVRNLTTNVSNFIVEVRDERKRRNEEDAAETKRKRDEMNRWKWTFIGLAVAVVPAFLWQVVVFWVKIAPNIK